MLFRGILSAFSWLSFRLHGRIRREAQHFKFCVASIVTMCEPLTAALLAWILFHEQLGPFGLLGAGCLLGAMSVILLVSGEYTEKGK